VDNLPMWQSWFSHEDDAEEHIRELKQVYRGHNLRIALVQRKRDDTKNAYLLSEQEG
jgi:hypothetical protein